MQHRQKALLLVTFQFLFIFLIIKGTNYRLLSGFSFALLLIAIALLAWAIASMSKSKLRVSPLPHANAQLVTSGPYRFTRHPMYTSVLLGTAALVTAPFSWLRLLLFFLLAAVLVIKLHFEESQLVKKFQGYPEYMKKSKRIIPFIY